MKLSSVKERLIRVLKRKNIAQKIALGYGVTIGIAVVGASVGLIVGSISESRAARDRDVAVQKAQLVARLESDTLSLALHPQYLLESTDQSNWLEEEIAQFEQDIATLRASSRTFEAFLLNNNNLQKAADGVEAAQSLRFFLDDYELWVEALWLALRSSAREGESDGFVTQLREARVAIFAAEWTKPQAEALQVELKAVSEQLGQLGRSAKQLEDQALSQLRIARSVRLWVVIISLLTSTALAIACAIHISQAIAKPIRTLTSQTHRITEEENFDLRVAVDTEDETSRLASSIDQLVRWGAQYTQELELAQSTLEQRVEERTQELREAQAHLVQSEKMSS
ncbi:MAG: HAMP domain-containing protein, partial [Cyanobacteria bacterium P01_H01_bin.130]